MKFSVITLIVAAAVLLFTCVQLAAAQNPCAECVMPHCCAMFCSGSGCCYPTGVCFMDGNCFGECTCGTPGCPSSSFWTLLEKNITGAPLSLEEVNVVERGVAVAQPHEVQKFVHRALHLVKKH